ncbi:MAG: P44/Msp2 family outer membrane protein [Pseudomonadota bacterium]
MMTFAKFVLGASLLALAPSAGAEGWYVSGSGGASFQVDSDNQGETGAFITGNLGDGTTLDIAAGTPLAFDTDFETGFVVSGEGGYYLDNGFRLALEVSYDESDVDTHTDVILGDAPIGALDAAALAGSAVPLGISVADLVADGQGDISEVTIFANLYYDLDTGTALTPYVGGGLGISFADIDFAPSGVTIINEDDTAFAYQGRVGLTYAFTETFEVFSEYTFRGTPDLDADIELFPGELDVENRQHLVSGGLRIKFGGYS